MKKSEIKVGCSYMAKISDQIVPVKVERIEVVDLWKKSTTRYFGRNLKTGRPVTIKSAAKFRRPAGLLDLKKLDPPAEPTFGNNPPKAKPLVLSVEEYHDLHNEHAGYCLACGEFMFGLDPDTRNAICETCEEPQVFGLQQLIVMNRVEIEGGLDDVE